MKRVILGTLPVLCAFVVPAFASVTISSPASGAKVSSPFKLTASASPCSTQAISTIGYSLDSSTNTTTFHATSISTSVSAATGTHTVHVKSWGSKGAVCVTDVSIDVTSTTSATAASTSATAVGAYIASTALTVSSIQTLGNWKEKFDTGTEGSSSGSMSVVSSPSLSGHARKFVTHYTNNGGELYYVSWGDDTAKQNFVTEAEFYLTSTINSIANIELDLNQVMPNGQTVIFGFQCDGWNHTWDFTENAGTATAPKDHWLRSSAGCDPRSWAPNTWHHIQIAYSRDKYGNVTYHSVWFDGTQHPIDRTVFSAFALHWGPSLVTNVQIDGLGSSGAPVVYVDKLMVHRW